MYKIIRNNAEDSYFQEVEGERVEIMEGIHTFIHIQEPRRINEVWVVSESLTGARITDGYTKEEAIERAATILKQMGIVEVKDHIRNQLNGVSYLSATRNPIKSTRYAGLREWLTI